MRRPPNLKEMQNTEQTQHYLRQKRDYIYLRKYIIHKNPKSLIQKVTLVINIDLTLLASPGYIYVCLTVIKSSFTGRFVVCNHTEILI